MSVLETLFPEDNFSLIAFILGMPLLGAIVNGVWGQRLGKPAVRLMALAAVGASFLAAVVAFAMLVVKVNASGSGGEHEHVRLSWLAWDWMHTTSASASEPGKVTNVPIAAKFSIDALSGVMMLVVTGVGFLIHLYATSYMAADKAYWRFFAYLNLFIFSMLVLILGDNLPVLFVGWEGVGLCSYLLIGFWYDVKGNAVAGKKAFLANRIGDFGLICGMFLLAHYCGALDWDGISHGLAGLTERSAIAPTPLSHVPQDAVHIWPLGGGHYDGMFKFLEPHAHVGAEKYYLFFLPEKAVWMLPATAIGIMLLLGCTGKSAQIPLYVWLPDAMAGPTPVSALIHAATMVTAGVYLVCRLSFLFVLSSSVMTTVMVIGAATALLAATIALVQNDIKKVLAYSTVSQLGFMFMGVGAGAFTAGFFHVVTHAFFKACLFLGAGSVIHGMHARIHDDVKSQDMRHMGGLKKYMPYTYWTFLVATAAIAGCPLLSGFFSKDEILYRAYVDHAISSDQTRFDKLGLDVAAQATWIGPAVYWTGVLAATMTAFYMFRVVFLTFHGKFRGWTLGRPSELSIAAKPRPDGAHGQHGSAEHEEEEGHHHEEDLTQPGRPPHESPWQMTVPLLILAALAVFAGVLNPAALKSIPMLAHWQPLDHWLEPVFSQAAPGIEIPKWRAGESLEHELIVPGILAFAGGTGLAYWMYILQNGEPARKLVAMAPGLHKILYNKWYVDEVYDGSVIFATDALADTSAAVDQGVVDALVARLSALLVAALGGVFRAFQNGVVHVYAAFITLGLVGIGWFFVAPHPAIAVDQSKRSSGDYAVSAGPGFGYKYRWDLNADGAWDGRTKEAFGDETDPPQIHLDADKRQTVRLEVENAFGLHSVKELVLTRPPEPVQIEVGQR